jgi:nucleoid-associated protein YgaU
MSLRRKSLAVIAAVAVVLTTVVLMSPREDRPVPAAPGQTAKAGGAKAPPEKGETAASSGPENQPTPSTAANVVAPRQLQAPSVLPPEEGQADVPATSPAASPGQSGGSAPRELAGGTDAPAPVGQTYVVKRGDTPATIAREYLGDASRWTEIARVNPGLAARSLKIGQILRLPEGALRQAAGVSVATTAKKPTAAPGVPAPSGEPLAVHRVAQGDTLYKLARKYYGDSSHWKLIQDANPTMVGGGVSAMRLDSELIIPALPGTGH